MAPKRALAMIGYVALGPISGPLVAGIFRNLARGELVLAGLYALALPLAAMELAMLAAQLATPLLR
jgi:hypothetical protein